MGRHRDPRYWLDEGGRFARFYGGGGRWSPARWVSSFLEARTLRLLALLDDLEGRDVLDLGCGSGVHGRLLAPRCRRLVGLDLSAEMLSLARREAAAAGGRGFTLVRAEAGALPFAPGSFDWVVSMGLLDYVPDPGAVLAECRRVLRDNGTVILTIPKRPSAFGLLRTSAGNAVKKALFGLPPVDNVVTGGELERLLAAAGFRPVEAASVWTTMWMAKAVRL